MGTRSAIDGSGEFGGEVIRASVSSSRLLDGGEVRGVSVSTSQPKLVDGGVCEGVPDTPFA